MFTERVKGQSLKWMDKADAALLPLYGLGLCLLTWFFNLDFTLILLVWVFYLQEYLCTMCVHHACRGQKKVQDLRTELQMVERALGIEPRSSGGTASALKH